MSEDIQRPYSSKTALWLQNTNYNVDRLRRLATDLAKIATFNSSSSAANKLTTVAIGASLYGDAKDAPKHIARYAPEFVRLRIYSLTYGIEGMNLYERAEGICDGAEGYCANLELFRPFWLR